MSEKTKITLSLEEKELISNPSWILTKRSIIAKVMQLFNGILTDYRQILSEKEFFLPAKFVQSSPKISRGENYLSLPYVLLDYPKVFDKGNVMAIRTLFWWGNFFSCTLHVSGIYKQEIQHKLFQKITCNEMEDAWICINKKEWEHHFAPDNYQLIHQTSNEALNKIYENNFIKIAYRFDLSQWESISYLLPKKFGVLISLVI